MNPYKSQNSLQTTQKIAMVVIALGDKIAIEVLKSFAPDERLVIEEAIRKLGHVPQELIAQSIEELNKRIDYKTHYFLGGELFLKNMVEKDQASIQGRIDFLDVMNRTDPIELAHFLENENKRTVVLILSTLSYSKAAKIISEMPIEKQAEMMIAFVELERLDQKSLNQLIQSTESALEITLSRTHDFLESACQILENLLPNQQTALINKIEELDIETARALQIEIFLFSDVQYLNKGAIQMICEHANPLDLRLAFYDSSEELKAKFFSQIPQKDMEALDRKLAQYDSITDGLIQEAQLKIIQLLHMLEKENKIHREAIVLQKTMVPK